MLMIMMRGWDMGCKVVNVVKVVVVGDDGMVLHTTVVVFFLSKLSTRIREAEGYCGFCIIIGMNRKE